MPFPGASCFALTHSPNLTECRASQGSDLARMPGLSGLCFLTCGMNGVWTGQLCWALQHPLTEMGRLGLEGAVREAPECSELSATLENMLTR